MTLLRAPYFPGRRFNLSAGDPMGPIFRLAKKKFQSWNLLFHGQGTLAAYLPDKNTSPENGELW